MQPQARADLVKKWSPILDHADLAPIKDEHRRQVTAVLLENQERAQIEERHALFETPTNAGGLGIAMGSAGAASNTVAGFDPVLISLVRRAAPAMIAYDMMGVQPMTQPTGLIFAMKSRYTSQNGAEALFNEADTDFAGTGVHAGNPGAPGATTGTGRTAQSAEAQGSASGDPFNQMAFSIERTSVTARSRALRAEYSVELAQDLKAVHGLDAEAELSKILSDEILAEINREVVRTGYRDWETDRKSTRLNSSH